MMKLHLTWERSVTKSFSQEETARAPAIEFSAAASQLAKIIYAVILLYIICIVGFLVTEGICYMCYPANIRDMKNIGVDTPTLEEWRR